ncbi:hypothetical protein [Salmonella enterica]|uniref:hypothetical protein n=1 Tax=Salmonella enterica TaxID=28901 RepID=UPI0035D20CD5
MHSSKYRDTQVLMITACDKDADRIIGPGIGEDDYVGKPFVLRELPARIRGVFGLLIRCQRQR